jgi:4-hydroxybutyrate CoA-transferase
MTAPGSSTSDPSSSFDWRARHAEKLASASDAVRLVSSGQRVFAGMFTSTAPVLCKALFDRYDELRDVTIVHYIAPFTWATPETRGSFRLRTVFASAADREALRQGRADYVPSANFRQSWIKETMGEIDVMLVKTSPPDRNGYMSFGSTVWISRTVADLSKHIICEVDERLIRTFGENYLHISEVDYLCETEGAAAGLVAVPARSEETVNAAEVICTLIAAELIHDGDTLQLGLGDVTTAMALYLDDKHDLGIQTELIPGGVVDLVKRGIVTGRKKQVAPGKVVGSAFAALPDEELQYAHMNPTFELWDFCHTDDLPTLVREQDFVAINNALQIDLGGQVTAETLNGDIYSGPGGQTTFAVAASVCEGGRSIIAVPSSSMVDGTRHSRILPVLPPGSVVTTPRSFVDYVVTEYGIATLRGKTLRQRADELIAVAHPDFRADLAKDARRKLGE